VLEEFRDIQHRICAAKRVGVNRHPSLRVALAISLVTSTGGDADYTSGNAILEDVMKAVAIHVQFVLPSFPSAW